MPPTARHTDPVTSHQAAASAVATGTAKRHAKIILEQIRSKPGQTAGELEEPCELTSVQITRRLNELRRDGLIESRDPRKCRVKGSQMQTHWPVDR